MPLDKPLDLNFGGELPDHETGAEHCDVKNIEKDANEPIFTKEERDQLLKNLESCQAERKKVAEANAALEAKIKELENDYTALKTEFDSKSKKFRSDLKKLNDSHEKGVLNGNSLEGFIGNCERFFYGKAITYVDVGAFTGEVARQFLESKLRVQDAHLFEPVPESRKALETTISSLEKPPKNCSIYDLAVSDQNSKVLIQPNKSMSKVVSSEQDTETRVNLVEVDSVTLDQFVDRFSEKHISILKVDVEGHEMSVLEGAKGLFSEQKIDICYIEVGLNPEGRQQCYYRKIDDFMMKFGYRIFRVFEQQYEWLEDLPFLRRCNIAFMSERFAQNTPFKVINELYHLKRNAGA